MPQGPPGAAKKKKTGHTPKHQNKFAFKHNPGSKKTDKILSSPNVHVCRRCHEKIEWRKQYRKYKPRTQPGKCNHCGMKNVKAAYHTICTKCSQNSTKSKQLIAAINEERQEAWEKRQDLKLQQDDADEKDQEEGEAPEKSSPAQTQSQFPGEVANETDKDDEYDKGEEGSQAEDEDTEPRVCLRICAICVKEAALPASDDEADDENEGPVERLTLRQRKTLERQQLLQFSKKKKTRNQTDENNDDEKNHYKSVEDGQTIDTRNENGDVARSMGDNDEEDPFLKAMGGADKLLTGEAYQKRKLLEEQQQPAIKSS